MEPELTYTSKLAETNLKEMIMQKIQTGEVSMKSKKYFLLHTIAFVLLCIFIFITTIFLISYTLFSIMGSGQLLLLGFGWKGTSEFFILFPWYIFLLDILLLIILDVVIRKFRFGYHVPIVYIFFGLTAVLVCIGYIVSVSSFHKRLLYKTEHKETASYFGMGKIVNPVLQPLYGHVGASNRIHGVVQGTITHVDQHSFEIKPDSDDQEIHESSILVYAPSQYDVKRLLTVGSHVFVAGILTHDGAVNAYGLQISEK